MQEALSNNHTYLYANDKNIFDHSDVMEIENVFNKVLQMYAIALFIISHQFILVTVERNALFSVGKKTYHSLT